MRALVVGAACAVLLACGGCPRTPAPPDAGPPEQLTEADMQPVGAREVKGLFRPWTLQLPSLDWRVVKQERMKALRPNLDGWLVNPATDAHCTVTCTTMVPGVDLSTMSKLLVDQAAKRGRKATLGASEALDGPGADAFELRYRTTAGAASWEHVHGFFDLVDAVCEVQAWTSAAKFPAAEAELRALVRSFRVELTPRNRVLADTVRVLRQDPAVRARIATMTDGGVRSELVGVALVEEGLPRLGDELIDERFVLRRDLLDRLDEATCGSLVRQAEDGSWLAALDKLDSREAERWGAINRAAVLAAVQGAMTPPRDEATVATANKALTAADPEVKPALATLKAVETTPDDRICKAERVRLRAAFTLERATRVALFREWLGRKW